MKEWKLSNREISEFCRSLSLLLRAGIHPGDGLFLMKEEESGKIKAKLEEMGRNLDLGMALSQALEEQKIFLEHVDSEGTVLRSNHVSNYVSLSGTLNRDKERMIAQLDAAISSGRIRPERYRRL